MSDTLMDAFNSAFPADDEDTVQPQPAPEPEPADEPTPQAEPPPPAAEPAPDDTPADRLLAGKYKDADALEKGYLELQSKLGDGDYRALQAAHDELAAKMAALEEAQTQPQYTPPPTAQPDWLDEETFTNPAQARELVLWAATNQPWAYDRAMSTWHEIDSRAATQFELEIQRAEFERIIEDKIAPLTAVPDRLAADDKRAADEQAINTAVANIAKANPDFADYTDDLKRALDTSPALARVIELGDPADVESALSVYLDAARGRRQQAVAEVAAAEAEETQAAKAKGTLTRATNTSQSTPKPPADPLLEALDRGLGSLSPFSTALQQQGVNRR